MLKEAGLISSRRVGTETAYRLVPDVLQRYCDDIIDIVTTAEIYGPGRA